MLSKAKDLYQEKKFKQSFLNLVQISNQASHDTEYLSLLYKVQIKLKDYAAAIKTLSVLVSKLNRPDDCLEQMRLLMSMNRHNEALDVGLELQSRSDTLDFDQRKQLFHFLIDIYIVFNDFEGLEEVLNQNHDEFISDAVGLFAWGLLHIHDDQPHDAILALRQAVYADPLFDKAWVSLAIMHYKMGDAELALANIEKALDINAHNPVAIKCFAVWKEQQGEFGAANKRVNTYLQTHNFDQDLTRKNIELLNKLGNTELALIEEIKLRYYFGHASVI